MKLDAATTDRLRELGATDDMLRWLERPDAVRRLLKVEVDDYRERCEECEEDMGDSHLQTCAIAAAWRALGDHRGELDIELAHAEAVSYARRHGL